VGKARALVLSAHSSYPLTKPRYPINIDGKYTRDLNTWQLLCRKCHMVSDGRLHSRDSETGRFVTRQEREEIVVN
jgi:hypothetical protein